MAIKCDVCGNDDDDTCNPVDDLLVCRGCFSKNVARYYKKHGEIPLGTKEFKKIFYKYTKEGKNKKSFIQKPMF